ncbi:MAG: hypothetical protein ABEK29_10080, partial [Bradymonadaceae bacterium]
QRARRIRSRLSPHVEDFWHIGPFVQTLADTLETPARKLGLDAQLAPVRQFFELARGHDLAEASGLPYWRRPKTPDADESPNFPADGCGLIWFSSVLPMRADDIARANRQIRQTVLAHGFEPMLFLQVGSKRSLALVLSLVFDREQPEQRGRARACIRELADWSAETGHYPYRLSLPEMDLLSGTTDDFPDFVRDLKQTLDPADILSPGRYDYREDWEDA